MGIIIKLDEETISKIAAGEIVEHPATVVKELIENSIDAGATDIKVNIENGGFKKIQVIDNGVGMDKNDLESCFLRHTTSKIKNFSEISDVNFMGFRGEALNSISAVSKLTIRSKPKNNLEGYEVKVSADIADTINPIGMPNGTNIIVEDLFYNTPARKKFFNNPAKEFSKILETIKSLAMVNKEIGFIVKHNEKNIINLFKDQTLEHRVKILLGDTVSSHFINFSHKENEIHIEGFIGKPSIEEDTNLSSMLFVNKRFVKNKDLATRIKNTYGTLLEQKKNPLFILLINLPQEHIDINLHPRKELVEFLNAETIMNFVETRIQETLYSHNLTPQRDTLAYDVEFKYEFDKILAKTLKESKEFWNIKNNEDSSHNKEIMQVHNVFLVIETIEGISLIDQHAAHERILYEEFSKALEKKKVTSECKKVKIMFDMPIDMLSVLDENLEDFRDIGINIEKDRVPTRFVITQIPDFYDEKNIVKIIIESLSNSQESLENKTLAFLACKSAIKAGDYLTQEERRNLVEKLEKTETKYTCPHGRPVRIDIKLKDLNKDFKRTK